MTIVTFGEVMGRFAPEGFLRFSQAMPGSLHVTFAGAEANVAASLAMFGESARFVSAVPRNPLGAACLASLQARGIDTSRVLQTDRGRLGLYFLETGANQRPSNVVYDRDGAAVAVTPSSAYDWPAIFDGAKWFHTTGITPAISADASQCALDAVIAARQAGCRVSCDLNFRAKLWRWGELPPRELAQATMRELLPHVDVVIANEEDCETVLGIRAADTDVSSGHLSVDRYPEVAGEVLKQFPNVSHVAITLRESLSASHNNWGAMLHCRDSGSYLAPLGADGEYSPYEIRNIVDRVGAGDSFAAGLIYAMSQPELANPQTAIHFAVAASCLAHSIVGDFNFSTREEVERLMGGSASGRVMR
ncbi:MAG: sugar kinase [Planctomycetales bacterium]|nr:sugar kinase [Planctomycetales bacterium]